MSVFQKWVVRKIGVIQEKNELRSKHHGIRTRRRRCHHEENWHQRGRSGRRYVVADCYISAGGLTAQLQMGDVAEGWSIENLDLFTFHLEYAHRLKSRKHPGYSLNG